VLDVNTDKLVQAENDKWQTRPLVREGAPQRQDSNFQTTFGQKVIYGHKSQSGLDTLTCWLTDRPSVERDFDFDMGCPVIEVSFF
jgi:hypothetical protein